MADLSLIRNFCIIAHIDHGKSTLADRFLELTHTVDDRHIHKQYLDTMDLEQEKGITIKLTPVRMYWDKDDKHYILNLIDTPGHVDFTYEVSRSLAACEGAILVVDATQGIEAQTLANVYLAMEQNLTIIPVVNKIDLPSAQTERCKREIERVLGFKAEEIMEVSAKAGTNVTELINRVVDIIPPPVGKVEGPPRALIFDSVYDAYKGAVAYLRMIDGTFTRSDKIYMIGQHNKAEILEVGYFRPDMQIAGDLKCGEVGYVATGLKNVGGLRVGDTVTLASSMEVKALPGYKLVHPKVYAGIYPVEGDDYPDLREAMERLSLNDSALQFEPETSAALGFGFRCGFLGLLHMDIVQERLEREYDMNLIFTSPNVEYLVREDGQTDFLTVHNPSQFPDDTKIAEVKEPWVKLSVITPSKYIGGIMELSSRHRGTFIPTEYLDEERVNMHYEIPLAEVIVDFYDELKSVTQGYASMDYEPIGFRVGKLQKLRVLVHEDEIDAFAQIVPAEKALEVGKYIVEKMRELLPRQSFEFKMQAMLGGKVIATERMSALRKDVIAKLYGGDRSRKDKLLNKQKKGKKRMKQFGKVELPQEAFLVMLQRNK